MTKAKDAIQKYAKDNGKTMSDIAKDLGIGRASLFNKMQGATKFTLKEGYKLSKMIGCSLEKFYEMTRS